MAPVTISLHGSCFATLSINRQAAADWHMDSRFSIQSTAIRQYQIDISLNFQSAAIQRNIILNHIPGFTGAFRRGKFCCFFCNRFRKCFVTCSIWQHIGNQSFWYFRSNVAFDLAISLLLQTAVFRSVQSTIFLYFNCTCISQYNFAWNKQSFCCFDYKCFSLRNRKACAECKGGCSV